MVRQAIAAPDSLKLACPLRPIIVDRNSQRLTALISRVISMPSRLGLGIAAGMIVQEAPSDLQR